MAGSGALRGRRVTALPGFGLTLGVSLVYLSLIVLLPLAALLLRPLELGWEGFLSVITEPRVLAALKISFSTAAIAAVIDLTLGLLIVWVLVRYRFPGQRIVDALIDLPFALPTAVAGISLASLYAPNGWLGSLLAPLGVKVAYTPLGIVVALVFVGLPFVVRSVQPVLQDLDVEIEEAAVTLGASPWRIFRLVILPTIRPALLTGFALAFARALGEYGSVIFIAGNLPMRSEIAPLLIVVKLEQFDYAGASALALATLAGAFAILFLLNLWQRLARPWEMEA